MHLADLTRRELIFTDLEAANGPDLLRSVARRLASLGCVPDEETSFKHLLEREQLESTGIGGGVAIPHCRLKGLQNAVLAVALTRTAIAFDASDGQPVKLFFVLLSPDNGPVEHLKALACVSKFVKESGRVGALLNNGGADTIYDVLAGDEA